MTTTACLLHAAPLLTTCTSIDLPYIPSLSSLPLPPLSLLPSPPLPSFPSSLPPSLPPSFLSSLLSPLPPSPPSLPPSSSLSSLSLSTFSLPLSLPPVLSRLSSPSFPSLPPSLLLQNYEYLFYLLQTNPDYFARLIFELPQTKTTKFMDNVILTVFNYATNAREQYLLVRLFEAALREEIYSKVDKISDIVTGNPLVIRLVVQFTR